MGQRRFLGGNEGSANGEWRALGRFRGLGAKIFGLGA